MTLLIGALVTWRVASLLVHEAGPLDLFIRLRAAVGITYDEYSQPVGHNEIAKALLCVWCTSVWVGLLITLLLGTGILDALAYSAGAIIVERWVRGTSND